MQSYKTSQVGGRASQVGGITYSDNRQVEECKVIRPAR